MRLVTFAFLTAGLLIAAAPASASERATDAGYVRAARCQGLIHAKELGAYDTAAIDAYFKAQNTSRRGSLRREAKAAALAARTDAQSPAKRARLIAERDRSCRQWLQPAQIASGGAEATATISN